MCTVSVIRSDPLERAIRLVCNRDELRARPAALSPVVRTFGRRRAVMPIDPVAGGTWIAANDAGLLFTLLNRNGSGPFDTAALLSRGRIIPTMLHSGSLAEALQCALKVSPETHQPFRLVILDRDEWCEISSDGQVLRAARRCLDGSPQLFTSSGLGDEIVQRPRRELFERMIPAHSATPAAQDAFHAHTWPGREHISVYMSRSDARTVSRTTLELDGPVVRMIYQPIRERALAAVP